MAEIKIKKSNDEVITPSYETLSSAGLDIRAYLPEGSVSLLLQERKLIGTGLFFEIPESFEVQIRPRSGLAYKNGISVLNSPGTIDSDYRGEIKVLLFNFGKNDFEVVNGLRVAQMVLCPIAKAELSEVNNLDDTTRGDGGFGSTGK